MTIGNSAAPYINNLAHNFGLATNYSGVTHPSLPNYMALTGGKTVFTSDCVGCTTSARHLVDQVVDSGRHWKAYMESMPTPCSTIDTSLYVQKHNPFVHYDDVVKDPVRCRHHVVPYTQLAVADPLARALQLAGFTRIGGVVALGATVSMSAVLLAIRSS